MEADCAFAETQYMVCVCGGGVGSQLDLKCLATDGVGTFLLVRNSGDVGIAEGLIHELRGDAGFTHRREPAPSACVSCGRVNERVQVQKDASKRPSG